MEHKTASADLVETARDFAEPGKAFEREVKDVEGDIAKLGEKLADLRSHSDKTATMVSVSEGDDRFFFPPSGVMSALRTFLSS